VPIALEAEGLQPLGFPGVAPAMATVIPITGAATLLRASLDRAGQQTATIAERMGGDTTSDFAAAVSELSNAKLTLHATAFVAHTLDELAGGLLSRPRK
jgi:hypothetical protein